MIKLISSAPYSFLTIYLYFYILDVQELCNTISNKDILIADLQMNNMELSDKSQRELKHIGLDLRQKTSVFTQIILSNNSMYSYFNNSPCIIVVYMWLSMQQLTRAITLEGDFDSLNHNSHTHHIRCMG